MNSEINAATRKWQGGEKVVIGQMSLINDHKYIGLTGTVDFEYDTLVYVLVRAKGQRKDRSICIHRDSLQLAS
jgi:hypothetical protein